MRVSRRGVSLRVRPTAVRWRALLAAVAVVGLFVGVGGGASTKTASAAQPPIGSWLVAQPDLNDLLAVSSDLPKQFFDNPSTDVIGALGASLVPAGWAAEAVSQATAEGSLGTPGNNDSCAGITGGLVPCLLRRRAMGQYAHFGPDAS
jgi:hypothetical protein